ncbi:MAG: hypothetical protein ABI321_17320 [Polyangia bacterium]
MTVAETFLSQLADESASPAIDWERYRLMQLIPGTAGVTDPKLRDQLVARGFVELAKGSFDAQTEKRSLLSLRVLVHQILGENPRIVPGFVNPMVAALSSGPGPGAPPNLARLLSAVSDIVSHAKAVTLAHETDLVGERLMTLLFVDDRYVGFLPAQRIVTAAMGRA